MSDDPQPRSFDSLVEALAVIIEAEQAKRCEHSGKPDADVAAAEECRPRTFAGLK
jgi:hypothetical protein